jgi:hypothetical protein
MPTLAESQTSTVKTRNTYNMKISDAQNIDELFRLWKEMRPEYKEFSNDGVLLEDVWKRQHPKIAFLLKEPNDDFYEIRGRSYGPGGNSSRFWRNLNMWSYTVKQLFNGAAVSFEDAQARKEDAVGHIAYINLKKKHESRSVADDADIQGYVERDWEFIAHQVRLIGPDVLFCGGTYKYIRGRLATTELRDRLYRSSRLTIIDFYHPSCRKSYKTTVDLLSSWPGRFRGLGPAGRCRRHRQRLAVEGGLGVRGGFGVSGTPEG